MREVDENKYSDWKGVTVEDIQNCQPRHQEIAAEVEQDEADWGGEEGNQEEGSRGVFWEGVQGYCSGILFSETG